MQQYKSLLYVVYKNKTTGHVLIFHTSQFSSIYNEVHYVITWTKTATLNDATCHRHMFATSGYFERKVWKMSMQNYSIVTADFGQFRLTLCNTTFSQGVNHFLIWEIKNECKTGTFRQTVSKLAHTGQECHKSYHLQKLAYKGKKMTSFLIYNSFQSDSIHITPDQNIEALSFSTHSVWGKM